MGIIKARKLSYDYIRYDEEENKEAAVLHAVKDVDLDIQPGQFIAVLGHNGSGKSTLAKHMNALLAPTGGTMWIDEMDTKEEANIFKIRKRAGMVFQNPDNQIIASVVEEDVGFGPENLGVPTEQIWKRVEEALNATGMAAYRTHSPNRLSGGQKQRVAIAGVMAMHPKCIILDEPTAMLDPNGRVEVLEAVKELNRKEGITVILITHYMEEVVDADRVYVMDDGNLVMQGTPREIFSRVETLQNLRLDVPQVTLLAHELGKKGISGMEGILTIEELVKALCQ
ncbi:MAG: energy-coupling factor transporter ATPase [Lachnospiraceae bacterium]|nr:energy-coupling factor transporter ATPase [Lachnospiraceae bacterium]